MSRLFVTQRELNFFSDIAKEVIKDIVGQKIIYYPVSEIKTLSHELYNEAVKKIFDSPIEIDALVSNTFQHDTKINKFGIDQQYKIEVFVQYRDMVEKGINVEIGDFFSFSSIFYEITDSTIMRNIYGLPEHKESIKIVGTKARKTQFDTLPRGPTDILFTDDDAKQDLFVQQRGLATNKNGETGDVRDLVKAGVLDPPLTGAREVSKEGSITNGSTHANSFYDED
jgi:hypothetical protein